MPQRPLTWTTIPNGTYEFSYTGTATVTFSDIGQLAGPVTVSNGVTTGTVIVNHATGDGMILDHAGHRPQCRQSHG